MALQTQTPVYIFYTCNKKKIKWVSQIFLYPRQRCELVCTTLHCRWTDRPLAAEMKPMTFYALIVTVPLHGRTAGWKKKNQFISPLRSTDRAAVHIPAILRQASVLIIISSLTQFITKTVKDASGPRKAPRVTACFSTASSLNFHDGQNEQRKESQSLCVLPVIR